MSLLTAQQDRNSRKKNLIEGIKRGLAWETIELRLEEERLKKEAKKLKNFKLYR